MYTLLHDLAVQSVVVRSLAQGGAQLCPAHLEPATHLSVSRAVGRWPAAWEVAAPTHALAIDCRTLSTGVQQQGGSRPQLSSRLPARSQPLPGSMLLPSGQLPARGQALPGRRLPADNATGARPAWQPRWRLSCRPPPTCMACSRLPASPINL